jgi:XisH protein
LRTYAIGAEKDGYQIAVEVKSFLSKSPISEFHMAMGQYGDYREALEESEPERSLYLAVPLEIFQTFFQARFIKKRIEQEKVKLLVYEPVQKNIIEWIH